MRDPNSGWAYMPIPYPGYYPPYFGGSMSDPYMYYRNMANQRGAAPKAAEAKESNNRSNDVKKP